MEFKMSWLPGRLNIRQYNVSCNNDDDWQFWSLFFSGEHLYKRYAHNRALSNEERTQAEKLASLKVPNKNLRQEMAMVTGKPVTLRDVANVKKGLKEKVS